MKFNTFAKYLQRLEETTKRLEMTDILTELISELDSKETDKAMYLASGYLRPLFDSVKFNIADKLMLKILENTFPEKRQKLDSLYASAGDLGDVVYELKKSRANGNMSISEAYDKLTDIAIVEGGGSQDTKIQKTSSLLKDLDALSAKYTTRIILGTIRLGYTELTIIAALANLLKDKKLKGDIEAAYNIRPDIGLVTQKIKEKGMRGLSDIKMEVGVPILSQKAQRVSGMEEAMERIPNVWAEFKFDGTRVQLHMDKKKKHKLDDRQKELFSTKKPDYLIKTFTRNLEETTHQYPEIVEAAKRQITADSIILDGEGVGYNRETGSFLPFQETIQRKRKYNITQAAKDVPLKYFIFDILYLNGKSLIDKNLRERREILNKVIKKGNVMVVDNFIETDEFEKLEEYFEVAREKGLEGLIAKNPTDSYQAGARSYSWIKLKIADDKLLDDSIDCVILGYYHGKGHRSQFGIGGFLVGIYDEESEEFKTISKIGTGLTEDQWIRLKEAADKLKVKEKPKNLVSDKLFTPDVYVEPKIVVEIGADEISKSPSHTAGYALRFPRLLKFRKDKSPTQITTLSEIIKMYKNQKNNGKH